MNVQRIGVLFGLLSASGCLFAFGPKTVVSPRSQSFFSPREHAGWDHLIYCLDRDAPGATIAVAPSYQHSFRTSRITDALFGCKELTFSGSQVVGRSETDILADYWGLPSDYLSVVQFDPTITTFLMDFNGYINLDGVTPGLFAQVHLPIVHTKWDLQLVECTVDSGTTFTSYPAGYLAATPIELSTLTTGDTAPRTVKNAFRGDAVFGDMREPLKFGKIFGRQNESRVADLRLAFGYNVLRPHYHFGFSLRAAAPTGTERDAEFLFEPIAGNDHHWELGGDLSGHVDVWYTEDDQSVGLYFDAVVTHLFDATQKRSFDLVNSCGSRYMLLQKMAEPVVGLNNGLAPNNELAAIQYQGRLVPAINKTTLDVKIGIAAQADVLAKINYYRRGFECEVGYNFWGRAKETLKCRDCIETCYAVKGDAQVYGFTNPGETPVALAATQSNATINGGQAVTSSAFPNLDPSNFNTGFEFANINADNIVNASDTAGTALNQLTIEDADRLGISQVAVRTSNPAILLTDCDIDDCSALLPKAISHTIFFSFSYAVKEDLKLIPYAGGGGFVQWASDCFVENSALSEWGFWFKGGFSFN